MHDVHRIVVCYNKNIKCICASTLGNKPLIAFVHVLCVKSQGRGKPHKQVKITNDVLTSQLNSTKIQSKG
jgi:hypothetical protein